MTRGELDILKMRKLHRDIVRGIEKSSSLTEKDLDELDIGEIEKKIGVKLVNPKKLPITFEWELGERFGWQFHDLDFVSEKEYEKREADVDSAIRKL